MLDLPEDPAGEDEQEAPEPPPPPPRGSRIMEIRIEESLADDFVGTRPNKPLADEQNWDTVGGYTMWKHSGVEHCEHTIGPDNGPPVGRHWGLTDMMTTMNPGPYVTNTAEDMFNLLTIAISRLATWNAQIWGFYQGATMEHMRGMADTIMTRYEEATHLNSLSPAGMTLLLQRALAAQLEEHPQLLTYALGISDRYVRGENYRMLEGIRRRYPGDKYAYKCILQGLHFNNYIYTDTENELEQQYPSLFANEQLAITQIPTPSHVTNQMASDERVNELMTRIDELQQGMREMQTELQAPDKNLVMSTTHPRDTKLAAHPHTQHLSRKVR
jgi:hypothetical protein